MISVLTRRRLFGAVAFTGLTRAASRRSLLSVEAYIFQQYASRQKKKLGDVLEVCFGMARTAGFGNIELNTEFFEADIRNLTLDLIRTNHLAMPSVYVGGVMHEDGRAQETIQRAVDIGKTCRPFGCTAVVHNPSPKPGSQRKSDAELATQTKWLQEMAHALSVHSLRLRVHHHSPEMQQNAREWHYILQHTDPKLLSLCMDLDWVHQGGQDPLTLLKEAGSRVSEIHIRNSHNRLWLETLEAGDIDYQRIAAYMKSSGLAPLLVVELAYHPETKVTRPLSEDLRLARIFAERTFLVQG
jgi:inosose dehydratase